MKSPFRYILFFKPYGVLSQFSPKDAHPTLADFQFPKNVYSVGRLDADSEGLLILTDDGPFQHRLIDPMFGHARIYHVQIENVPAEGALEKLRRGVVIEGERTKPAKVAHLEPGPSWPERSKPIRTRKNIPTCWLEIAIAEGRNRQVRKMTASVGHPALRLIRTRILGLGLDGLSEGEWRYLSMAEVSQIKSEIGL